MAGAGDALGMMNGTWVKRRQWDDQFAAFGATHTVVCYHARGHGQSSLPPAPFSHSTDLHALVKFLGIERAVLMGCSGGGGACIDFALAHPSMVNGLILVGSNVEGFQLSGSMSPTLTAYVQALQGGDIEQALELSLKIFTAGAPRQPAPLNP